MAEIKWDEPFRPQWSPCPVVDYLDVGWRIAGLPEPQEGDLQKIFTGKGFKLQTWGRPKDSAGKTIVLEAPHWIAVRGQTPLHYDPRYPRYSHHLKLRVDPGIKVRGWNKQEFELRRGIYYVLDTHSPHQVMAPQGAWNVAVSMDAHKPMDRAQALDMLIGYARTAKFNP